MKLWEKGYAPDQKIEEYTVGKDPVLDQIILPYDLEGSRAHVLVLENAGLISKEEAAQIAQELLHIKNLWIEDKFQIRIEDEDCHTAIEKFLVARLGETGKKIHTARSRNDQVLTALRLYQKDKLQELKRSVLTFIQKSERFARDHSDIPMPGYTHTRKAMPYSISNWSQSFVESAKDDLKLIDTAIRLVNKNPLGTGAGYGVSLPLNRDLSASELGFKNLITNALYAQNSRGKTEAASLFACTSVLSTLNRWASDLVLFSAPEFGFFDLDDRLTTGSSIMPHKKNPDVLELIRASVHQVSSAQQQILSTSLNLISGYHRDLQLTKEPLINGISTTLSTVSAANEIFEGTTVNEAKLRDAMSDDLYSVEKVYDLVKKGIPFRKAYQIVASELFSSE